MKRVRAFFERISRPGTGTCRRCRRPWGCVEEHVVWYRQDEGGGSGAFALCDGCWGLSSDIERLGAMYLVHGRRDDWGLIDAAVRASSLPFGEVR